MDCSFLDSLLTPDIAVIPVLIGPVQVLLAILPGILIALATALASLLKPRVMWQLLKVLWRLKIQVAILIACVVGIRWLVLHFQPQTRRASGTTANQTTGTDWTIFRGGMARTGASGTNAPPASGGVNWAVQKDERFYSSPAVVGNRIYVASVGELSPFDKEGVGKIYCFDAANGGILWSATPSFKTGAPRYRGTFASPVIKGSYLVCGEGLHVTKRCRVVCLDLTPGKEGTLLWSHQTTSHVECSPAIATVSWQEDGKTVTEDRVFVGAGDTDGYYCFSLTNGAVRWHLSGKDFPDAETSLTVYSNRVYAGQGNEGKSFSIIDAVSGKLIRKIPMPYPVFCPPAIKDGKLIVGMGNGDYVASAADLKLPQKGEVWCFDLAAVEKSGETVAPEWTIPTPDTVLGSVAIDGNDAYFCSANGVLHHIDISRRGKIMGTWNARDLIKASPAVSGNYVYVMVESGVLYAVDRTKLEPVWTVQVGRKPLCVSSPAIAHGRVYVGTEEDGFVCAGQPSAPTKPVWNGYLGGPGKGGNPLASSPAEIGQLKWNWPAEQDGSSTTTNICAPVAVLNGRMFIPVSATAKGLEAGLVCVPAGQGKADGPGKALWSLPLPLGVHQSVSAVGDRAFFIDGVPGNSGRKLRCLDSVSGKIVWERPVADGVAGVLAATAESLFAQETLGTFACVDHSGNTRWTAACQGRLMRAPTVLRDVVIAAVESPDILIAVDIGSGRTLWQETLERPALTSPVVDGTRIVFGTAAGLDARNILNGKRLAHWTWSSETIGGVSGEISLDKEHIAFVSTEGRLVILRKMDGTLSAPPLKDVLPGSTVLPGNGMLVYFGSDGGMMQVSLDDIAMNKDGSLKPKPWLADTSAFGRPASPMVLSDGNVYAAWPGWGLVCLGPAK